MRMVRTYAQLGKILLADWVVPPARTGVLRLLIVRSTDNNLFYSKSASNKVWTHDRQNVVRDVWYSLEQINFKYDFFRLHCLFQVGCSGHLIRTFAFYFLLSSKLLETNKILSLKYIINRLIDFTRWYLYVFKDFGCLVKWKIQDLREKKSWKFESTNDFSLDAFIPAYFTYLMQRTSFRMATTLRCYCLCLASQVQSPIIVFPPKCDNVGPCMHNEVALK